MFYKYVITNLNKKEVIYLYLNQDYEISSDLFLKRESTEDLIFNAENFLKNCGVKYKGKDIYLVVDYIIVGKVRPGSLFMKKKYLEYNRFARSSYEDFLSSSELDNLKLVDFNNSFRLVQKYKFQECLFGVIAREMPFIDQDECLKAQAVLARTCLFSKNKVLDVNQYKLFYNKNYLKQLWKDKFEEYYSKIMDAICETKDEVLTFQGKSDYQNTNQIEVSEDILKFSYPYFSSVESVDNHKDVLLRSRRIPNNYLEKLLKVSININTPVEIIESTSLNDVRFIRFGNKVFDGLLLARTLGLVSNNYTVQINEDCTTFLVRGCGYGLKLSKCGALVMANSGYTYQEILKFYYPNSILDIISENTLL